MGRGSHRKVGKNKPSKRSVRSGTKAMKQFPFKFEGRPYVIVPAGKRSTVYKLHGRKGTTLRKVKDFAESQAVLRAFSNAMKVSAEKVKEKQQELTKERFS